MSDAIPMPPAMVRRVRDFRGPAAVPRAAATVVLLRPRDPFEVYVLRRAATMVFGGRYAFPGGGVDPSDRPETLRTDWSERLGVPDEQARAVVGAAVRELFEEAGVLLAGPVGEPDRTLGDVSAPDWEADRVAVAARELTLSDLLHARGLRLRDDLLLPWARWVTPEFEPKRFDTRFFVAAVPTGQRPRDVSGEADDTVWLPVSEAVARHDAGGLAMLPPTIVALREISAFGSVAEVLAAPREVRPVLPRLARDGGRLWLQLEDS